MYNVVSSVPPEIDIVEELSSPCKQCANIFISVTKQSSVSAALFSPWQAKASGKKPQKVTLKVSPQGIVLHDSSTNKLLENVSIYRYV